MKPRNHPPLTNRNLETKERYRDVQIEGKEVLFSKRNQ